jgi:hypothetical protein
MSPNKEKYLFETYPKIFIRPSTPKENLMFFGFECGDGWFDLIDQLCKHIQSYIDNNPHLNIVQPQAIQVKEKYGTLRFYAGGGNEFIRGMISQTEWLSGITCEICGSHERIQKTQGYIRTLCGIHYKQYMGEVMGYVYDGTIRFDDACKLKVGDIYYEVEYGMMKLQVVEAPTIENDQVRWKAKMLRDNYVGVLTEDKQEIVDYLMTKGFEHYGPKIYWTLVDVKTEEPF